MSMKIEDKAQVYRVVLDADGETVRGYSVRSESWREAEQSAISLARSEGLSGMFLTAVEPESGAWQCGRMVRI